MNTDTFAAWYARALRPARPPEARQGDWITLLSGHPWWAHDPHPDDVREDDFPAIALVMRWGGHMRYALGHPRAGRLAPYSVGQHSCLVYEVVTVMGGTVIERACALFHDLHKITPPGDVLTPVGRGGSVAAEELRLMGRKAAICFRRKLGLPIDLPPIVKRADAILLATERRDIAGRPPPYPHRGLSVGGAPAPLPRIIEAWDPDHTAEAFDRRRRVILAELADAPFTLLVETIEDAERAAI